MNKMIHDNDGGGGVYDDDDDDDDVSHIPWSYLSYLDSARHTYIHSIQHISCVACVFVCVCVCVSVQT